MPQTDDPWCEILFEGIAERTHTPTGTGEASRMNAR
jgi:hypothetical protein